MNQWLRVTTNDVKPMQASGIDLTIPVPDTVQAWLDKQYKQYRSLWLGNQHIKTNEDGSIKSIEINAQQQMPNAYLKDPKIINRAEILLKSRNITPTDNRLPNVSSSTSQNRPQTTLTSKNLLQAKSNIENLPVELPEELEAKLNAFLNASESKDISKTTIRPTDNYFGLNDINIESPSILTLNELDTIESQSIALQKTGQGVTLSDKTNNDIAQLKAAFMAQTMKQTENVINQVNSRYNPFAGAQQAAKQQNLSLSQNNLVTPNNLLAAQMGIAPQAGVSDKQNGNGSNAQYSNGASKQKLLGKRKQTNK